MKQKLKMRQTSEDNYIGENDFRMQLERTISECSVSTVLRQTETI